jgi:hypothetical protein
LEVKNLSDVNEALCYNALKSDNAYSMSGFLALKSRASLRFRLFWVVVALVCVALFVFGIARYGVSHANVSTLRETPAIIWVFFVAPCLGFLIAVSFLVLPNFIGFNLIVCLCLWALAEVVFGQLITPPPLTEGEPQSLRAASYYHYHPRIGYALEPDNHARHRKLIDGVLAYEVGYVIDKHGRRQVTGQGRSTTDRFILFFGGSNIFGEGLNQSQTLPDQVQRLAPGYSVYNYGMHGYGVAQMLDLIASRNFAAEVTQPRGLAVFYFIPGHMGRLVGASNVVASWGRHFSYYKIGSAGRLVREGDFSGGRQFLSLAYGLLHKSKVLKYFGIVFPLRYTEEDYELAAEIVLESQRRLQDAFETAELFVVLSPTVGTEQAMAAEHFASAMRKHFIPVIDLTDALDLTDRRYRISQHDYHQSAEANRILAQQIIAALDLR